MRSQTSQRWTGTPLSASKPRRTLMPRISSTVTLSNVSNPLAPPTTTDSLFLRDNTNMTEPPFSSAGKAGATATVYLGVCVNCPRCSPLPAGLDASTPGVRGHAGREQEHLDDRARGEDLHHGAGHGFNFGGRFAHADSGDPLNLLPQPVGRIREQA